MSTKIWEAYKVVDNKDLWPLVHDIRIKGTKAAEACIKKMYDLLFDGVDTNSDPFKEKLEANKGDEYVTKLDIVSKVIRDGYKVSSVSPYRDVFDFNLSIGIRQFTYRRKSGLYIIPYAGCGMNGALDFLKRDPRLVDYHYQNQTDPPKDVPKKEWELREKIWHGMDKAQQWGDVLVLEICAYNMFYQLDPHWSLYAEYMKQKSEVNGRANHPDGSPVDQTV
jgi:hypothetical protein